MSVFKEESTPIKFQSVAASSLSSLTIDDEDEVDDREPNESLKKSLSPAQKPPLTSTSDAIKKDQKNEVFESNKIDKNFEPFEDNTYFSADEEKILDEYIRRGIAKVSSQNVANTLKLNFPGTDPQSSSNQKNNSKITDSVEVSTESNVTIANQDECSDLTSEEEKLLNDCIRRGIAKITRQNIESVRSLGLKSNLDSSS